MADDTGSKLVTLEDLKAAMSLGGGGGGGLIKKEFRPATTPKGDTSSSVSIPISVQFANTDLKIDFITKLIQTVAKTTEMGLFCFYNNFRTYNDWNEFFSIGTISMSNYDGYSYYPYSITFWLAEEPSATPTINCAGVQWNEYKA